MKFRLVGKNIELTDGIRDHFIYKISKVFKHTKPSTNLRLSFCVEKKRHIAHAILNQNGVTLFAADETKDLYASADNVLKKIETNLKKNKARALNKKLKLQKKSQHLSCLNLHSSILRKHLTGRE